MNTSELRQLIKEEISNVLNERTSEFNETRELIKKSYNDGDHLMAILDSLNNNSQFSLNEIQRLRELIIRLLEELDKSN